jgi:L-2-hydroxyglutarate oxidase LhgO
MSSPLSFDAAVIGAGVIGIATAKFLAEQGAATVLLESQASFGSGISSRNSEVIHAGIYYPPGSLKAQFCVAGSAALYRYCTEHGVQHQRIGKLIVATHEDELPTLDHYRQQGENNGVTGLKAVDSQDLRQIEPALQAAGALLSPNTGIIDSHGLMTALLYDFEQAGGIFVRSSPVVGGKVGAGRTALQVGGTDPCIVEATRVVNSAGLAAQGIAHALEGFPRDKVPPLHYAIGHYYEYAGQIPFRHLVYPVASRGGLGIHLTLDLAGRGRFGPDISWCQTETYTFDDSRRADFSSAIRRYWPHLLDEQLAPAYTGIRPKLWGPTHPEQDFIIQDESEHGIPGLINLFGIESPGLTSALAIAQHIAGLQAKAPR